MWTKAFAAVAMTAALCAATPAAAITLTFDIEVTSAVGDPTFTPFTFQETWSFTPTPSSSGTPTPGMPYNIVDRIVGAATVTASPLTAGIFGGFAPATYGEARFARRRGYDADGDLVHASAGASFGQIWMDAAGTETFDEVSHYARTLDLQSAGFYLPASVDEAGLIAFFKAEGPIQWAEGLTVTDVFHDGNTPPVRVFEHSYKGTATLVTGAAAVPEPAAWALMIGGFAVAGGVLRTRRRALPLAA